MTCEGFQLEEGETVKLEAAISKKALIIIWVSVPAFLIIDFLAVYLPQIITVLVNTEIKNFLLEKLGLEQLTFSAIRYGVYSQIFSFLPVSLINFVKGLFTAMLVLLILIWAAWGTVVTKLNLQYSLLITDKRVLARAKSEEFITPLSKINNIVVGRSIWGKLLRYGEITIQAEKGSVTVKNIANAEEIKNFLYKLTEQN